MLFTEKALNGKTNRTYVAGKWAKFRVDPFDKAYREGNAPTNKLTHIHSTDSLMHGNNAGMDD